VGTKKQFAKKNGMDAEKRHTFLEIKKNRNFLVLNTPLSPGIYRTHHQHIGEIQTGNTPTTHTDVLL
jgi:hypothetical protein